ncbi:hypothetical protein H7200_03145 [Candidatus Saccharibacteria bacterium]|nr:hypothetical protein [Candidatus Saccharibacteria bacterium]
MYPNQPQQPETPPSPLPSDYLNQIAPQAPKRMPFKLGIKQVALLGGALILLVIILSVVVNSIAGGSRQPLERLSARLTATESVVVDAQSNLKSSQLRSLNSNLKIYMTNTNRDVTAPLLTAGIESKKISASIVTSESTDSLTARLENARLNAVYDRTYAREMSYQLSTLLTLMNQIYGSTNNQQLKTFLKSSYDNLVPTQKSFADFSTAE